MFKSLRIRSKIKQQSFTNENHDKIHSRLRWPPFLGWPSPHQPRTPRPPPTLPPASTKTGVTFDTDIKPIFTASCMKCHDGTKKPRGGIALDTLDGVLKGGTDGPILTVGDSTKGSLVNAVAHIGDSAIIHAQRQGRAETHGRPNRFDPRVD